MLFHFQEANAVAACGAGIPDNVTPIRGAVGIAFALRPSGVTCSACLEELRMRVAVQPLHERLRDCLDVPCPSWLIRSTWVHGGIVVVADEEERRAIQEAYDLPGLRLELAAVLATRGRLVAAGYEVTMTPRATLRLAELGAIARE